jgi:hypothetical protein
MLRVAFFPIGEKSNASGASILAIDSSLVQRSGIQNSKLPLSISNFQLI